MASKVKVNTVETESGSTLTIGKSGDTVTLASGASQSGFGRSGSVDWDTTAKTASFTAVSGNGYFVDTSSSAITVTMPASPSAGDIVAVADYTRTFSSNNCTIARNGSNMGGVASNVTLSVIGQAATFVYVDSTEGWINVQETSNSVSGRSYVTATGGTITTSGNYKIHTFTGPGTFCVSAISTESSENTVSYVVIGGGGAGGKADRAGGGGAGGFREYKGPADCYTASPLNGNPGGTAVTVTAQAYPVTVGGGGTVVSPNACGANSGSNSVFSTVTSAGGGGGGSSPKCGLPGGSGGGGYIGSGAGGTGNTPPVSPAQGKNGGTGPGGELGSNGGGGGGGATVAGLPANHPTIPGQAGTGGDGATSSITGSPVARAGGGGGGACSGPRGVGGSGGGGTGGSNSPNVTATAGTANTGGGGGGNGPTPSTTGSGGSGVVIIRYKFQN